MTQTHKINLSSKHSQHFISRQYQTSWDESGICRKYFVWGRIIWGRDGYQIMKTGWDGWNWILKKPFLIPWVSGLDNFNSIRALVRSDTRLSYLSEFLLNSVSISVNARSRIKYLELHAQPLQKEIKWVIKWCRTRGGEWIHSAVAYQDTVTIIEYEIFSTVAPHQILTTLEGFNKPFF